MSVSLYYQAKREQPLTSQEISICQEIVKRYDDWYPFGELYEDDIQILFDMINYWVECLDEITKALLGATWDVHLDDMEMIWGEEGWRFPENDV